MGFIPEQLIVNQKELEKLKGDIERDLNAKIVTIPPWSNFYMHRHLVHAGTPHSLQDFSDDQQIHLVNEHQALLPQYTAKLGKDGERGKDFIDVDRAKQAANKAEAETPFATAYFSHFSPAPNAPEDLGAAFRWEGDPLLTERGFVTSTGFDSVSDRRKLWVNPNDKSTC